MSQSLATPRVRSTSYIVIPGRMASTRLPKKLLLSDTGKSLIQHTYEAACQATHPTGVCVATDHEEIIKEVHSFGGHAFMTPVELASGTDRVALVARQLENVDIVVNVQGDEPELSGESIDLVIELLDSAPDVMMSTLATPIRRREQLQDPACVKVVFGADGRALYFSRSPIPAAAKWTVELLAADRHHFYQHVGIYAYRRRFLLQLTEMPRSPLEQVEGLEQLRALEAGYAIRVGVVDEPTFGIDTEADYRAFVQRRQNG